MVDISDEIQRVNTKGVELINWLLREGSCLN